MHLYCPDTLPHLNSPDWTMEPGQDGNRIAEARNFRGEDSVDLSCLLSLRYSQHAFEITVLGIDNNEKVAAGIGVLVGPNDDDVAGQQVSGAVLTELLASRLMVQKCFLKPIGCLWRITHGCTAWLQRPPTDFRAGLLGRPALSFI